MPAVRDRGGAGGGTSAKTESLSLCVNEGPRARTQQRQRERKKRTYARIARSDLTHHDLTEDPLCVDKIIERTRNFLHCNLAFVRDVFARAVVKQIGRRGYTRVRRRERQGSRGGRKSGMCSRCAPRRARTSESVRVTEATRLVTLRSSFAISGGVPPLPLHYAVRRRGVTGCCHNLHDDTICTMAYRSNELELLVQLEPRAGDDKAVYCAHSGGALLLCCGEAGGRLQRCVFVVDHSLVM